LLTIATRQMQTQHGPLQRIAQRFCAARKQQVLSEIDRNQAFFDAVDGRIVPLS
jgi:hypothetical protein